MNVIYFIGFLLSIICQVQALKILAVLPMTMKSHYAIGHSIVESLLDAGHEVTEITCFVPKSPIKNLKIVQIPDVIELMKG
jgi:hypothetical protein